MEVTSHLVAIAGVFVLFLLYSLRRVRIGTQKIKGMLAPEPAGALPIIGHLHQLSVQNLMSRTLAAMADKHGPVFMLRFGMKWSLVISNHEAVKECFTTNDMVFAARPRCSQGKYLGCNFAAFGFESYGTYWREMRKLTVVELLSSRRLMLKYMMSCGPLTSIPLFPFFNEQNEPNVDICVWIERLTLNIITKIVAGKRYFNNTDGGNDGEAQRIGKIMKEFMHLAGVPVISNLIPFLGFIDLQGQVKSMKRVARELDYLVGSWVEEHNLRRLNGETKTDPDFINVLLSEIEENSLPSHNRETIIKATALNLILAGAESVSINLAWILSLLLNNKHALKRAQEELDLKVGRERWVADNDIKDLVYLQAITKESLRLYPPSPLSVPHEAMEDCTVCGYYVPKGTSLFVNVGKLQRDPRVWQDPEQFLPERFLTSHANIDASGRHFEFIPFGSGRRSCPGNLFALQVAHLTLARLLQGFELATPLNAPVDMTEGLGISLPRAAPLEVLLTPRLSSEPYQC